MLRKKRKQIILGGIALLVLIAVVVVIVVVKSNTTRVLKCKSLSNTMTINFEGNKPVYVRGVIDLDGVTDTTTIKESIEMYSGAMMLNEEKKVIKYSFNYSELNIGALNYVGLNYNKDMDYNQVKSDLQNSNYYCK